MPSQPADAGAEMETAQEARPTSSTPRARKQLRIAMLLHKDVSHDTRVLREASALATAGHRVTVIHLPPPGAAAKEIGLEFNLVPATVPRGRQHLPHPVRLGVEAARLARRAVSARPDVVHAHDAAMLLPGLLAARLSGAKLVYDSHELATGVPYRKGPWAAIVAASESLGAPRADAVLTVSDGIAERLSERYTMRRPPAVVRNLPDLPPPGAVPVADLRQQLGIGTAPLILHQGAAVPGRGCETLLRALWLVPDAHLLYLGADGPYAEHLRTVAAECGLTARTHLLGPAPPEALLSYTAQADVGVSLLEDRCENHRLALPNKLFEYVAAGLPVVVADLPEAGELVRQRRIGQCADSARPESVAAALREVLARRDESDLKDHLRQAAEELSWKLESQRLLAIYDELAAEIPSPMAAGR